MGLKGSSRFYSFSSEQNMPLSLATTNTGWLPSHGYQPPFPLSQTNAATVTSFAACLLKIHFSLSASINSDCAQNVTKRQGVDSLSLKQPTEAIFLQTWEYQGHCTGHGPVSLNSLLLLHTEGKLWKYPVDRGADREERLDFMTWMGCGLINPQRPGCTKHCISFLFKLWSQLYY